MTNSELVRINLYLREENYGLAAAKLEDAVKFDIRDFEAYKRLFEIYFYLEQYDRIAELIEKLIELSSSDRDFRIRYLLVKGKLFKDYRDYLQKGNDLRQTVSDICSWIDTEGYDSQDRQKILSLLSKDFLMEGDYLRGKGKDAAAVLKYKSALSVDPDNERAKEAMYFAEKFLHSLERPHFCAVSLVFRCMLRCKMCRIWKNNAIDELPIETWKGIVDNLTGFMDENRTINFAGGEPLLKDGLIDLVNYSRQKGFKPAICTNGWLIDEDMAKRLADSGIDIIAISLDSLNEKTHDYLRGVRGSYKKAMDAIGYLNKHNKDKKIRIHVQPIISEANLEDLIELTHFVNGHEGIGDITFLAIIQPPNTNSDYQEWYKKEEFKMLWPKNIDRIDSVMKELIRLKLVDKMRSYKIGNQVFQMEAYREYFRNPLKFYKKRIQCNIGTQFVNIYTNGDVKLCHYSDIIIGNVAKQKARDIWNSELANSVRDKIKLCDKKCHQILNCMKEENPYINKVQERCK